MWLEGLGKFKNQWPHRLSYRQRSWVRHYARSRKVTGSIHIQVIGFSFNLPNSSSRTMALGSTQPLTEMKIRNLAVGA
jgi:hypothetical protein